MKTAFTVSVIFFTLITSSAYSQYKVIPEDQETAKKIRKSFPENEYAAIRSDDYYTFAIKKSDGAPVVTAQQKSNEQIISLKDNIEISKALFFDEQSQIDDVVLETAKGGKVAFLPVTANYQSDGIFYSDAKITTISEKLPTLGLMRNISYKKQFLDVKYLTREFFHEAYPVLERTVTFEVPDWLTVEFKEFNFEGYTIEKKTEVNAKGHYTLYTYKMKNVNAYKQESSAPPIAYRFPHIVILCKEFSYNNATQKLFGSVDDLYAWYSSLVKKVNNDETVIRPVVQKLVEGKATDEDKIKAIFYWLQENIRYIAYENGIMGYKPENCQKVYNNKFGDCKGMANLAKAMYHVAGYDARLTWLGTNDIPYDYSTPSMAVDNHMICTIILKDKKYFIDATESWIAFNDYASRIQGRQVLIEDGNKYMLDKIPAFGMERNKIEVTRTVNVSSDKISGSVKRTYNGESKTTILRQYAGIRTDKQEEALKKFLVNDNPNLVLKNVKKSDFTEREKPLTVEFEFDLNNAITKSGKEMYINIEVDKTLATLTFDSTRINDYELDNKYFATQRTEFIIPAGYKIDYTPDAVDRKYDNFSFHLTCRQEGKKVIYEKQITIDNGIIPKKDFLTWNSCIKDIRKFYNDQIVLVQ
jgi:hypothetical protein